SGNHDIDEFLISTRTNTDCHDKIANYKNTMNKNSDPLSVYSFIERELKKVVSSNNSSSRVSKQVCTSEECKFDTDNSHNTQRSSSINSSSGYISKDLDMDIETNTQRLTTFESSSIKSSSDLDMDIETNTQRLSTIDISSMSHNISHPSAIYTSRPLSALISHVKNNRN
ncbi:20045_t:CDS:2, partial [Rhizophagus irregularis]